MVVAAGHYTLTAPLEFGPQDSGSAAAPIRYEAAPGARPVFSGGRLLRGWKPGPDGLWQTQVPEVAASRWYFEQLWVNGRRATRARTPNRFWFRVQGVREQALTPGPDMTRADRARQTLTLRPEDFSAVAGLSPEELNDAHLVVYHNWDNTRRFIESLDESASAVVSSGRAMKPWNPWKKGSTCVFENFRRALDTPGEWFLARDGTLSYWPLPGENLATVEVVAPWSEKFLVIQGDPAGGRFFEHVTFRGLTFHHGQWLTPPGGFEPAQAASPIEAVVLADGARHVTIEDCEFGHFGLYGVWFRSGCRDNVLRCCHVFDFGAGGVRIGETRIAEVESERTSHITVDNNIIRHGGYLFPCAVGIWVGHSADNRITHNEVADLFYSGLSIGWRWGYAESLAKRNTIAYNHVHHLGWGLLSDMGGIYTLGPSEGTVVTHNVLHDIYAYSYGGWGLYTDEGCTGILFQNNLVYDTKTGSFHQHYGRENVVRNNILVNSEKHQLQATRVEPHRSFTFERNIVYWTNSSDAFSGPWDKLNYLARSNCYWHPDRAHNLANDTLRRWQARTNETGTIAADPLFLNPAAHDFRLASNSPVLKLGFRPWDCSQAGVYGDPAWIATARNETYPVLERPPEQ